MPWIFLKFTARTYTNPHSWSSMTQCCRDRVSHSSYISHGDWMYGCSSIKEQFSLSVKHCEQKIWRHYSLGTWSLWALTSQAATEPESTVYVYTATGVINHPIKLVYVWRLKVSETFFWKRGEGDSNPWDCETWASSALPQSSSSNSRSTSSSSIKAVVVVVVAVAVVIVKVVVVVWVVFELPTLWSRASHSFSLPKCCWKSLIL